jgi:dienelactone hydrolase
VAKEGYVVLPVHYFDRTGVSEVAPKNIKKADLMDWMDTVRAAVAYARHSGVGVKRVGLLGFSLGACLSLALAAREDVQVAAIVDWFGSLPKELRQDCKRLPPTLVIHGGDDKTVPVAEALAPSKPFLTRVRSSREVSWKSIGIDLSQASPWNWPRSLGQFDPRTQSCRRR